MPGPSQAQPPSPSSSPTLPHQARTDAAAASSLVDSLIGAAPTSIHSRLAAVLAADPTLPPLTAAPPAATLVDSPALRPSAPLNAVLGDLVRVLTAPRPAAATAAACAALDDDPRAAAVRAVAAAAERELEMDAARGVCERVRGGGKGAGVLDGFAYVRNYEVLCDAEVGVLAGKACVATRCGGGEVEGCGEWRGRNGGGGGGALGGMRVAFCGAGPLPLSGVMLHVRAGARVALVEVDVEAAAAARRLVRALEEAGVVDGGALEVVEACATEVRYCRPGCMDGEGGTVVVECDAVVIASLLPGAAKEAVVMGIGAGSDAPGVVLVRSAVGLVARLAYERAVCGEVGGMVFCGEWVPLRGEGAAEEEKAGCGDVADGQVLGFIDGQVLNSVQVYRRKKAL